MKIIMSNFMFKLLKIIVCNKAADSLAKRLEMEEAYAGMMKRRFLI